MKDKYALLPTFRLRSACIDHVIKTWKPGHFIEFGSGTGLLTKLFLSKGYSGVCYDISQENIAIIQSNLSSYKNVSFNTDLNNLEKESFDYIFAFDVLEHIENDSESLEVWSSLLKPGGRALFSVPAHMSKFGMKDEIMGHYRRYERNEIYNLLKNNRFKDIEIVCYGFPLLNITGKVIDILFRLTKSLKKYKNLSCEERSIESGVKTPDISKKLVFLFGDTLIALFSFIQKFFFTKDIGAAYVVYGTKE